MSYPYAKRGEVTDTYFGTVVAVSLPLDGKRQLKGDHSVCKRRK